MGNAVFHMESETCSLNHVFPAGKKKQEMFQLRKPARILHLRVSVSDSESLLNIFHISHTFCGWTPGALLLPVMKSVNYWSPAAALWISMLHSLCDLQCQQKYMIALTQTTKTCRWS